jgi:Fe-Mn family superoxide dismutase
MQPTLLKHVIASVSHRGILVPVRLEVLYGTRLEPVNATENTSINLEQEKPMNQRSEAKVISLAEEALSRRDMMRLALAGTGALVAGKLLSKPALSQNSGTAIPRSLPVEQALKLPPLPYSYSALNRAIDTRTMRLHHDKHHAAYVKNLNEVINATPSLQGKTPQTLIMNLNAVPQNVRDKVRNNGGGHVNHTMFWQIMSPDGGGQPTGQIGQIIRSTFGSFDNFKTRFNDAGAKRFGSGWVWLVANKGRYEIVSTPNQDNPLMNGMFPIMGNDVWEHAYYLRYQNHRPEYLKAWWSVVNWDEINRRLRYMNAQWS